MHLIHSPLNELEAAVLEHLALGTPALGSLLSNLNVQQRELTGAGSYTHFEPNAAADISNAILVLEDGISIPGLPNGLGAALYLTAGCPDFLEIFTIGNESWSGDIRGFCIGSGA